MKITLSLLISLVLCGGFAVFSFTPLFNIVETTFFQPRIEEARQDQLLQIADRVARYHRDNFDRLQPTLGQPFVPAAFEESGQQAREDIFERQNWFGTLLDGNPNIQLVRILGSEGKKIHFSTLNEDIESRDRERIKYLDYERTGETIESADLLTPAGADARVIIDGEGQRFIYSFPVVEEGNYRGVVLFYVASRDLLEYLLRFPALDVRELSLLGRQGIVFNIPLRDLSEVESDLLEIWRQAEVQGQVYQEPVVFEKAVEPGGQDGPAESGRESYSVLSLNTGELGVLSLLIPYSVFQLQPIMKIVVVTAIFLTVFLGIYLVLNLRQDPVLVLTQRVKRLQLDILKEFIEGKEGVDWQQWRSRLENNRGDLKSRIKRGIGRIPSQREQELDRMIDRSWDEIISIIEARVGAQRPEAPDIRHIEQLLQRALEGAQLTVQAPVQAPPQPAARRAGLVVEEIGVEEVVEPGEVIPSAGEELEEVEEAETVEEAEELEEAEGAEEAEELEEAEEVEEAETVEEAEELEEAEEVEEAEELEEA
ncbi:MAG: hypothetical protein JXB06_05375, partial [Spirochaetales bacterium]|nr:hypothetical protein [Spirochaetales bacterium]